MMQNKFGKEYRSGYKNIFPRVTYTVVILIYAKVRLAVREVAHKSAATKLSDYYGITAEGCERTLPVSFRDNSRNPYYCLVPKDVAQFPFKVKS